MRRRPAKPSPAASTAYPRACRTLRKRSCDTRSSSTRRMRADMRAKAFTLPLNPIAELVSRGLRRPRELFGPGLWWCTLLVGMEGCAMGQVLHGSARTTAAVRRAIQHSQESLRSLAQRHGINPKTVAKWKKRPAVQDERTGPKQPKSTVLSLEEAIVVAFRRHTLLTLDDCLYALQPTIPHLTRSSLHRCL